MDCHRNSVTNERATVSQVVVTDMSGEESKYTLDRHGFQLAYSESIEKEFVDEKVLRDVYFPETEEFVKRVYVSYSLDLSSS